LAAETIRGPGDGRLGRLTLAEADGRAFQALLALAGTPAVPTLVWSGWTTLAGDAGERHGQRVDVGDVDGDGVTDVLVGILSETTRVCGREELPLLHRRGYDWASHTLRPVSGARPGLDPAAATDVAAATERFMPVVAAGEGSLDAVVAPWSPVAADATLVPLLEYRGASSSLGDGADPLRNSPPGGLEDMDARTGWAEGVGGAGKLEFVTARVITTQLPARWLAVRAIDGADATAPKTRNRVKSLLLVDGAGHSWRVALADGREERAGALTWFELPAPLEGGCVTATVLDTWPAISAEGRRNNVTWISDLQVFGAVSLPADAPAVRAVLDDDASSVAAARLLRALGGSAVQTLGDVAAQLGSTGAARAAAFLAGRAEPEAIGAVARLLAADDASAARAAREAVARLGEGATGILVALLSSPEPKARATALELLGEVGGSAALPELLSQAVQATEDDRPLIRRTLAAFLGRQPGDADEVLAVAGEAARGGREAVLVDLLRVTPLADASVREEAARLVTEGLGAAQSFEARYFLIRRAADLLVAGETSPAEALLRVAQAAAEPELRTEAAQALAAAPGTVDLAPLLDDPWPGVREAAATAMGSRGVEAEQLALATRFAVEAWPVVRAAAAAALLRAPAWPGDDVARRLLDDPSVDVRDRTIAALDERGDEPSLRILAEMVEDHGERLELRQRALASLAAHCWPELKPLVVRVVEWSIQAGARRGDQALALDAIRALGTAGPPGIRSLLEEIAREAPVAPMLAAALAALGDLGEPEARAAIEPHLRAADPSVADAAQAALQALERGRAGRRCGE
jgi:HEAT repeat protein